MIYNTDMSKTVYMDIKCMKCTGCKSGDYGYWFWFKNLEYGEKIQQCHRNTYFNSLMVINTSVAVIFAYLE